MQNDNIDGTIWTRIARGAVSVDNSVWLFTCRLRRQLTVDTLDKEENRLTTLSDSTDNKFRRHL
jgi:hypothetical protein